MTIEKEKIEKLTNEFGKDANDTGSAATQIAIFTERINNITSHLKTNKKDNIINLKRMKKGKHKNRFFKNRKKNFKNRKFN